jgi:hypothetical protein
MSMIEINGMAHVILTVSRFDLARTFYGSRMIPDRDIWRAANLLIREHSADAEVVAARRADEMLERDGQLVWHRIRRAIVELAGRPCGSRISRQPTRRARPTIGDIDRSEDRRPTRSDLVPKKAQSPLPRAILSAFLGGALL